MEFYDAQDSEAMEDELNLTERSDFDDEDKVMHTLIGRTELSIDKILQQLLVSDVLFIV